MKNLLNSLKVEQNVLINDLLSLALTYERARKAGTKISARAKAKRVTAELRTNEGLIKRVR